MAIVKRKSIFIIVCIVVLSMGISVAQDWPQWRGSNRDGKVIGFKVPDNWPKELTQKWKITVGEGTDSTPALVGDKLYVFTRQGGEEVTLCLDANTKEEIWKDSYEAPANVTADRAHAGPRSSPAVAEGMVVTFGISGTLSCLDAASGKLKWRKNDFPGALPQFNTAMSPMIVDSLCIGHFGGQNNAAVAAYELSSGNQKWKWDSPGATHSSPNLMILGDTKIAVVLTPNNVVGINIADGSLLFEIPFDAGRNRQCVTPVVEGAKVICCGTGQGMKAVEIKKEGDKYTVNDLWTYSDNYVEYNTPVIKDGFLFAVSRQDQYFCVNAETGQEAWIKSSENTALNSLPNSNITLTPAGFGGGRGGAMGGGRGGGMGGRGGRGGGMGGMGSVGYGTIVDAGSVLIGMISSGQLTVLEPDGKEYKETANYKVGDGPIYAYPVVSGNRIYVMDQTSLALWTIE